MIVVLANFHEIYNGVHFLFKQCESRLDREDLIRAAKIVSSYYDINPEEIGRYMSISDKCKPLVMLYPSGYEDRNRAFCTVVQKLKGTVVDLDKGVVVLAGATCDLCFETEGLHSTNNIVVKRWVLEQKFTNAHSFNKRDLRTKTIRHTVDMSDCTYSPFYGGHALALWRYEGTTYLSTKNKLFAANSMLHRSKYTFQDMFLKLTGMVKISDHHHSRQPYCRDVVHFTLGTRYHTKGSLREVTDCFLVLDGISTAPCVDGVHKLSCPPVKSFWDIPEDTDLSLPLGAEGLCFFKPCNLSMEKALSLFYGTSYGYGQQVRVTSSGGKCTVANADNFKWNKFNQCNLDVYARALEIWLMRKKDLLDNFPDIIHDYGHHKSFRDLEVSAKRNGGFENMVQRDVVSGKESRRTIALNALICYMRTLIPSVAREVLLFMQQREVEYNRICVALEWTIRASDRLEELQEKISEEMLWEFNKNMVGFMFSPWDYMQIVQDYWITEGTDAVGQVSSYDPKVYKKSLERVKNGYDGLLDYVEAFPDFVENMLSMEKSDIPIHELEFSKLKL